MAVQSVCHVAVMVVLYGHCEVLGGAAVAAACVPESGGRHRAACRCICVLVMVVVMSYLLSCVIDWY